jgi:hypothetical protein
LRCIRIAALSLFFLALNASRAQERPNSVELFGTFIGSSKLFHHPDDPDELVRSQFLPLNDIFSAGVDIRHVVEDLRIQIGVSAEYISKTDIISIPLSSSGSVPVRDGFTAIPVELSGYFFIPLGDEKIRFYMGGGGGAYFGTRRYSFAGAEAVPVERNIGFGIHVLSGAQYALGEAMVLRSELKFRDVQFETTNRFEQLSTTYVGRTILLDQTPLRSRVNIDGMTLTLGLVFRF